MDKKECKKIKALLPYLNITDEQKEMTERARKSLMSFEHCLRVYEDGNKYTNAVAQVWNVFFDRWRGQEYDYLLVTANDVEHDPLMVDFMIRCMDENSSSGIVSCKVTRDIEVFKKGFGQQEYTKSLTSHEKKDPATFLLRKGVIEKVGRVDETFPCEFVERDYLYRCRLAGYDWIQPDVVLSYHPPFAGTIGNDISRLNKSLIRYKLKWGGDADNEVFTNPYNDLSLDYTYAEQN